MQLLVINKSVHVGICRANASHRLGEHAHTIYPRIKLV